MSSTNDPRIFFAAERTLLAWNRSCLSLMGFGFVIERFGLFLRVVEHAGPAPEQHALSSWLGLAFILLGTGLAIASSVQYRQLLRGFGSQDIPPGYRAGTGLIANVFTAAFGIVLAIYLTFWQP